MSRNSLAAIAAIVVVAAAIILGFWSLGTPARERQMHQDARTAQALQNLAGNITMKWRANKAMPLDLEHVSPVDSGKDPTTHAPFVYHQKNGTAYELCATFLTNDLSDNQSQAPFWRHGKGAYCFQLDATQEPPPPPPVWITY